MNSIKHFFYSFISFSKHFQSSHFHALYYAHRTLMLKILEKAFKGTTFGMNQIIHNVVNKENLITLVLNFPSKTIRPNKNAHIYSILSVSNNLFLKYFL